jgi:hypothetical protein
MEITSNVATLLFLPKALFWNRSSWKSTWPCPQVVGVLSDYIHTDRFKNEDEADKSHNLLTAMAEMLLEIEKGRVEQARDQVPSRFAEDRLLFQFALNINQNNELPTRNGPTKGILRGLFSPTHYLLERDNGLLQICTEEESCYQRWLLRPEEALWAIGNQREVRVDQEKDARDTDDDKKKQNDGDMQGNIEGTQKKDAQDTIGDGDEESDGDK